MKKQRSLFDALDQAETPESIINANPFSIDSNSKVIPVSEHREMVKVKKTDYDKWKSIPSSNVMNNGFQVIYGNVPSKSNSYKIITIMGKPKDGKPARAHSSLGKTNELRAYEKSFFTQCGGYRDRMISTYFELIVDVFYPSQRPDLDNGLKIILDCLQTCRAIKNDNLCRHIDIRKHVDKQNPRVEFLIKSL